MGKIMPLEILSSIKGAKSSEAVEKLFQVIKRASTNIGENNILGTKDRQVYVVDDLRDDTIINSSEIEKNIIKGNFPKEKNGFLVVSKVIED